VSFNMKTGTRTIFRALVVFNVFNGDNIEDEVRRPVVDNPGRER
jgi:hypothetical protein